MRLVWLAVLILPGILSSQSMHLRDFENDALGGPSKAIQFQNRLFFSAYTPQHGRELWVSDGSKSGTFMLLDIAPGAASSLGENFPNSLFVHNNLLYFQANDGVNGFELWRSDGTPSGTFMLVNAVAGSGDAAFSHPAGIGNTLYFVGGSGNSLWKTDGSSSGTNFIQSFQIIRFLTAFDGHIYFSAGNNNQGEELWRYRPANNTTQMVMDLNGGLGASLPCNFIPLSNTLLFMANTQSGWEWWRTNGTAATTQLVVDINPGGANGVLNSYRTINVAKIGDEVFFRANDGQTGFQLWKSDGTAAGTSRISQFNQSVDPNMGLPIFNGKVHYSNYETPFYWAYDPIAQTNQPSFYPSYYYYVYPHNSLQVNQQLVYAKGDSTFGFELFVANGLSNGIQMLDETDLSNNWNNTSTPGFNRIIGHLQNVVFFSNRRTHSDSKTSFFAFDLNNMLLCHPPSVVEVVSLNDSTAHVVWSQIEESEGYELRYRAVGSSNWQLQNSLHTFFELNGLSSQSQYQVQLRAQCNGQWGDWSEDKRFTTTDLGNLDYAHTVSEKAESSTSVRLYWRRSSLIQNLQIRYRAAGSSNWLTATSNNGYRKLNNLNPSTFYEYQTRADLGNGWGSWPSFNQHFYTPSFNIGLNEPLKMGVTAYPNPTNDWVKVNGFYGHKVMVFDLHGHFFEKELTADNALFLGDLKPGLYIVQAGEHRIKIWVN